MGFERVSAFRRARVVGMAVLALLLATGLWTATAAVAPTHAHGFVNPNKVFPSFKGWVYVGGIPSPTARYRPLEAYYWNAQTQQWEARTRPYGMRVYAWPFDNQTWHWAWSADDGWMAMRSDSLSHGYSCTGPTCPMF